MGLAMNLFNDQQNYIFIENGVFNEQNGIRWICNGAAYFVESDCVLKIIYLKYAFTPCFIVLLNLTLISNDVSRLL